MVKSNMANKDTLNHTEESENVIKSIRRRNNEASKRFRDRKRAQIKANQMAIKDLYQTINQLNDKIRQLTIENKYWKLQIKKLDQQKLESLLKKIKADASNS
ncbi:hypothetical protein MOSE0_D01200 [Monosporozyma servazzii]